MKQKFWQRIYHANANVGFIKKCHSVIQINDGIMINVDVTVKNGYACEKDYIYFYSLLAFLLVSIALLIAVSIYF